MTRTNWWMAGYNAAMAATRPHEISDALAKSGAKTEYQCEAFTKGWRSAWNCERRNEG